MPVGSAPDVPPMSEEEQFLLDQQIAILTQVYGMDRQLVPFFLAQNGIGMYYNPDGKLSYYNLTPAEQYKTMTPQQQMTAQLQYDAYKKTKEAMGEDYVDPGLEKEIASSQAQMTESLARSGGSLATSGTAGIQQQSTFDTNSAIARENARLANENQYYSQFQGLTTTGQNLATTRQANTTAAVGIPLQSMGYYPQVMQPFERQRMAEYDAELAQYQADQEGMNNLISGTLGAAGTIGGALLTPPATLPAMPPMYLV